MKKLFHIVVIICCIAITTGATFEIDAARNASLHNNIGVNYMRELNYFSAIKEFEIAIMLNPDTQASAIYYNNLGKVYLKIGYPALAEKSFKEAIKRNGMNFEYYQNLVTSFKGQNKLQSELKKYQNSNNPTSAVYSGLILIEMGKLESGINRLDEFCFDEPEMILTKGVRAYIQKVAPREFRF